MPMAGWTGRNIKHPYEFQEAQALVSHLELDRSDKVAFWMFEFPKTRGTLFWGPHNKDPII